MKVRLVSKQSKQAERERRKDVSKMEKKMKAIKENIG